MKTVYFQIEYYAEGDYEDYMAVLYYEEYTDLPKDLEKALDHYIDWGW